jgi:RNase P/RNase MRP subunit p29
MRSSSKKGRPSVAQSELIGLRVTVESRHAGWNGLEGQVVDETKQTFLVELDSGPTKRVPKPGNRFSFHVGNERFVVNTASRTTVLDGRDIEFRPEDRTKRVR